MDMLVEQTHDLRYQWRNNERPLRFTDTRVDEQSRGISMKSTPMSLVLEASSGKSFVMNMVDTPGTAIVSLLLYHCCCIIAVALQMPCSMDGMQVVFSGHAMPCHSLSAFGNHLSSLCHRRAKNIFCAYVSSKHWAKLLLMETQSNFSIPHVHPLTC